jgi:hypothetical protein
MDIYSNSHLPKNGWILGCFTCVRPTSNTISYPYNNKINTLYLCRDCCKNNKDNTKAQKLNFVLHNSIKRYIDDRTLEPYKQPRFSLNPPNIKKRTGCPPKPPLIPAQNHTPPHELDAIV